MKRNYYDLVGDRAWRAHLKAEALRYFFDNFKQQGTCERDEIAQGGISLILEEISNDARIAHDMLDSSSRPIGNVEAEDLDAYRGGFPKARIELDKKASKQTGN